VSSFAVQLGRHALAKRGDDLYETPECATRALIRHEGGLHRAIWEPACGRGAISRVLEKAGHAVTSTDLVSYGYGLGGRDFLMERDAPDYCDQIVTNPPFKLMDEFVSHGLEMCRSVIVLARWAYAEGVHGSGRRDGLRSKLIDGHLARVWLGRERPPFMHRDGYEGPKNSNSGAPFAWFVFEREPFHPGAFSVKRISWEDASTSNVVALSPSDPPTLDLFGEGA